MNIEFMFNNIVDNELLYRREEVYSEIYDADIVEVTYTGTEYCREKVTLIESNISEIKNIKYNGQIGRIAREEYIIELSHQEYVLSFTIDTFNEGTQAQLYVNITTTVTTEYDHMLEKLKISLKEALLKDWKMCTWIIDEQSELLGMELYPFIFKTENKMRAFINKVLTYKFGVKWMELIGLEDIIKSHKRSNVDFKREVPEFNNINDFLICATAESLAKLMLKSKIYETNISFSDAKSIRMHNMLVEGKEKAVYDELLKSRKVRVDIWEDIFKNYFVGEIEKGISNFIKNRNHVAHNKPMTKAAFDKMSENIHSLEFMLDNADERFRNEEPSDELNETWNVEQDELRNEQEYKYERISNETGVNILFYEDIFSLFDDSIRELYDTIDDSEYFSYAISISSLQSLSDESTKQVIFSVDSNVDESFSFNVCTQFAITEGMGEDSYLRLWIETSDSSKLLEQDIVYHNGEAHEDSMECYYVPDSESYYEREVLKEFIVNLENYIQNDMNTIKAEADTLSFTSIKDGGNPPVADFSCWNCYQNYISIDNSLYPYGYCMNCGEENEISKCIRCETLYPSDEGGNELCNYCLDKFENE